MIQAAVQEVAAVAIAQMVQSQEDSIRRSVAEPLLEQLRHQNEQLVILQAQLNQVVAQSDSSLGTRFAVAESSMRQSMQDSIRSQVVQQVGTLQVELTNLTKYVDGSIDTVPKSPRAFGVDSGSPISPVESRDDDSDLAGSLAELSARMHAERQRLASTTPPSVRADPAVPEVAQASPNTLLLDRIQQSRARSDSYLHQVKTQNERALALVPADDDEAPVAVIPAEPSSPGDLPDGGVDTNRTRLRLVPSSSTEAAREAEFEKELIDQIRAEAEEVSFEEVEREAEEAVRNQTAAPAVAVAVAVVVPAKAKSPRPAEPAASARAAVPSSVPQPKKRLSLFERQAALTASKRTQSPKTQTPPANRRSQDAPAPARGKKPKPSRSPKHRPTQPRHQPKPAPEAAARPVSPKSVASFKKAGNAVVAAGRFATPPKRAGTNSGGAGRGSDNSGTASARMSEEGECGHVRLAL